ncbi:MAG TPA: cation transporter [Actinomycetota bacterium]|nr:cation transporter [Actinomycetota bacterium]
MSAGEHLELPPAKQRVERKAVRLEYLTIAYLISAIFLIYLTLGSSQAMKTAWAEDILSLIPPIAFLIATRVRKRQPDQDHPYGWHGITSIAYLVSALALLTMGTLLILDAAVKLLSFEHPSIGVVTLFGHHVWLGWLMIPAALYSAIPAALLGRRKLPLAGELHDKVLFADAKMNKADWLTGLAASLGVLGIAWGLWWADAVAALVISTDILHDGVSNIRVAVSDLMNSRPQRVDQSGTDPLPQRVANEMRTFDWVRDVRVRMREEGHVYFGEVFVEAASDDDLPRRIERARQHLKALDWRLHDIVITPVPAGEGDEASTAGPGRDA